MFYQDRALVRRTDLVVNFGMRRILYLAASFATMWSMGCDTSSHHHGPSVNRGEYGCFSDTECATGLICVRDKSNQGGACRIGECNRERCALKAIGVRQIRIAAAQPMIRPVPLSNVSPVIDAIQRPGNVSL